MLVFDPRRRLTVSDALKHPFFESLHQEADEPVCPTHFDFAFEQVTHSLWIHNCSPFGWSFLRAGDAFKNCSH
jgi:hypothetical protein